MNLVRMAITLFVVILIVVSIAGWLWTGTHQSPSQATASRVVLTIGILTGIAGLVAIWRSTPGE
jgi:hypothetical protein